MEWHAALNDTQAVVLDCRNLYESDLGRFEGAIPLRTETFKDTWVELERVLRNTPRDTKVLTYCTGGIRCVKVGAFLTQRLGFVNAARLEGGIVNYTQTLRREAGPRFEQDSKYRGLNFVFNDRMAERVTNDMPVAVLSDPRSLEARALVAGRSHKGSEEGTDKGLEEYAAAQSGPEPPLLGELRHFTAGVLPEAGHMVSGHLQGRLLVMLTKLANAQRVLEIGTFTGNQTILPTPLPKKKGDFSANLTPDSPHRVFGSVFCRGWGACHDSRGRYCRRQNRPQLLRPITPERHRDSRGPRRGLAQIPARGGRRAL
jgi:rhodanese-related sulfurtransferase